MPYHSSSHLRVIIDQPIYYAVGVFAEYAFEFDAIDVSRSVVVSGLNPSEDVLAVHDVRLAINDRTTIEPRGQQIARINVTARPDFSRGVSRGIFIRRQTSLARHCGGNRIRQR